MRNYLTRYEVEATFSTHSWQGKLFREFAASMTSESRLFPCVFGVAGFYANQLRFNFSEGLRPNDTAEALATFVREARDIGANASFVLITKPGPVLSLDRYRQDFWSFLKNLSSLDLQPWPHEIPEKLDTPEWEFSFAGEPIFVVCNTPAHVMRQSRRSSSLMITFQPRWVFDSILNTDKAAERSFSKVRGRLAAFDLIPASPALGRYGDVNTREFAQYFLDEHNGSTTCPFVSLRSDREEAA